MRSENKDKNKEQKFLSLKEAAEMLGYASDYVGWLIRKGRIKGKKVYSGVSWQTTARAILSYKNKKLTSSIYGKFLGVLNNLQKTISLKEAAKISGYEPNYIGWLIRSGKIPGKKVYARTSWQIAREEINRYLNYKLKNKNQIKKSLAKIVQFKISGFFSDSFTYLKTIFRQQSVWLRRAVTLALIFAFLVSGLPLARVQISKALLGEIDYTVSFYSGKCQGNWQYIENVQGPPTVSSKADIEMFSKQNSAVYTGGTKSIVCSNFLSDEKNKLEVEEEKIIEKEINETDEEGDVEKTEEKEVEEETEEINEAIEETTTKETEETEEKEEGVEKNTEENNELSFGQRIKTFFGLTVRAEEEHSLEEMQAMNITKAFIKFSFAFGEEVPDLFFPTDKSNNNDEDEEGEIITITNQNIKLREKIKSFGVAVWEKIKNTFVKVQNVFAQNEEDNNTEEITLPQPDAKIVVFYSTDGENWQILTTLAGEKLSNALNAGYFTYEAPFIKNWQDVENLQIKFEGIIDGEITFAAYLDSVWLEIKYQEKEEEFELIAVKDDWRQDEEPEFEIRKKGVKSPENILEKLGAIISPVFEEKPKINVVLINPEGQEILPQEGRNLNIETALSAKIKILRPEDFQPGLYKLKITFEKKNKVFNFETEFSWGVLAINTNKSIYLPNEQAYLQMAVLNEYGHTICNASLKLQIVNPKSQATILSTEDGTIQYSDTCGANNVTDKPDYFAYYQVGEIGIYQMKLTNLDNGYEIEDSFEVRDFVSFDVERISATRINPFTANYTMTIKIKANQDFEGKVIETIPDSFEIKSQSSIFNFQIISNDSIFKQLIWEANLKKGENYELKYEYDAPDISPYLYLLGPLEFYAQ